jgi:hypothetical protein
VSDAISKAIAISEELKQANKVPANYDPDGWNAQTCSLVRRASEAIDSLLDLQHAGQGEAVTAEQVIEQTGTVLCGSKSNWSEAVPVESLEDYFTANKLYTHPQPAVPDGEIIALLGVMCGWFEYLTRIAGWTSENAPAAFAGYRKSKAALLSAAKEE